MMIVNEERTTTQLLVIRFDQRVATQLLPMIRQVRLDDALVCPHGRLERIRPEIGFEHYLLYQNGQVTGLQYVRARHWLDEVQTKLAALLSVLGFTVHNTTIRIGGAQTPLSFEHNRVRHLFQMDSEE